MSDTEEDDWDDAPEDEEEDAAVSATRSRASMNTQSSSRGQSA